VNHLRIWLVTLASSLTLGVGLSGAQVPPEEPAADARLHAGPLTAHPRLAIRNVGVDTNVYNESARPTRDLTATFGPELDSWLRVGRLRLAGRTGVQWTYFRDQSDERSLDASVAGRASLDLGWLRPHASGWRTRTRQRPNLEIDARVKREERSIGLGVDVRLGPRLWLDVARGDRTYEFDPGLFGRVIFADALNRRETETTLIGRWILTPLTTIRVTAGERRDRFETTPLRNSDSQFVIPGIEFKPLALVSGTAAVGYKRFRPLSDGVPSFVGAVADVQLSYLLRDLTRISVIVRRDVDYSFEDAQPYYVSDGSRLSVIQALGSAWDVTASVGRTALAYRTRGASGGVVVGRRDRVLVTGLGVGRRMGREVRVGVDIEYAARVSSVTDREYAGVRAGGVVTYGFD
jgi:hypothetical protein